MTTVAATKQTTVTEKGKEVLGQVETFFTVDNYAPVFLGTLAVYGILEVIHHVVLEQYVMGWLASTGLSMTVATGIYYGLMIGAVALTAWGLWTLLRPKKVVA